MTRDRASRRSNCLRQAGWTICALAALYAGTTAAQIDCRPCHTGGAKPDFEHIYRQPAGHHPIGVPYPTEATLVERYYAPDGRTPGIAFFDGNRNGVPDADEIQLFEVAGRPTVDCASCHDPIHGAGQPSAGAQPMYLRTTSAGSALCLVCHRQ